DRGVPRRVDARPDEIRSGGGLTNAERGVRNAELQCKVDPGGKLRGAKPAMTFRIPHSTLRILAALFRINVAEELQYRANFVASLLGTLFWIVTALLTLAVFFRHTTRLGDWDYWEVVVLLGVFNTLTGVIEAVLRPGIGRLAGEVKSGGLDLVLAKPVDAQGFVSFRRLDVWRFSDVVLGLVLAGYALHRLGRMPSVAQLAAFGVTLAAAVVVVYALWVALMSLAFWFVSVENLSVLFDAVYDGARYPVSAYPGALRFVFPYLIPVACTTTITASALTVRRVPRQHLVHQHAHGEHVVGRRGRRGTVLPSGCAPLRRHIGGGAQRPRHRPGRAAGQRAFHRSHDPGVGDQGVAFGEEDVFGLQVAVGDVGGVGVGQRGEHIAQNLDCPAQRQLAVTGEPGAQRGTLDERARVIHERAGAPGAPGRHEGWGAQALREQ